MKVQKVSVKLCVFSVCLCAIVITSCAQSATENTRSTTEKSFKTSLTFWTVSSEGLKQRRGFSRKGTQYEMTR